MQYKRELNISYYPNLGCDPEFFIEKDGIIDGSERIIPEKGFNNTHTQQYDTSRDSRIKRDGVQCEINTKPVQCRAFLHNEVVACFQTLKTQLNGYKPVTKQVIKMDKKVLDNLSKEARRFGCAPSNNAYTKSENKINVSPSRYLYRSAGGHLHIGKSSYGLEKNNKKIFDDIPRLVEIFDIVVGCTSVLLDRDIWVKERRKVYGRAGDYRITKYGFEYRTLSNFWLKDYIFLSLVFGLARMACEFVLWDWDIEIKEMLKHYDIESIINNNDMNQAIEVFNILEPVYNLLPSSDHFVLNVKTTKPFRKFFMSTYKPEGEDDLIDYWTTREEGHRFGFNEAMYILDSSNTIKQRRI